MSLSSDLGANEHSVTFESFATNLTVGKAEGSKQISPAASRQGVDKLLEQNRHARSGCLQTPSRSHRRLFRKAVQQGRSKQRGEAYSLQYVEPLSVARTPLADFVNSLLGRAGSACAIRRGGGCFDACVRPHNRTSAARFIPFGYGHHDPGSTIYGYHRHNERPVCRLSIRILKNVGC
jgi:hypothetical protein